MHTAMSILHVLCAVFLIGPMAVLPMTGMRALRSGDTARAGSLARSTFLLSLLSILTVIFGFGLMSATDAQYNVSMATTWIWLSLLLYVVALALNLGVVVPSLRTTTVRSVAEGKPVPAYQRAAMGSGVASLLLLVVVLLMVWKP